MISSADSRIVCKAVQNVLGTQSQATSKWKIELDYVSPWQCHTTFNFSFSLQKASGKIC